ncbi:hypothetical protein ACAW74_25635 [Fibrella sp. WM1]|uniref:hypothetical protein n=1 Tax=Fibrella musci TaxID=3242485 RepID=UPI003521140E
METRILIVNKDGFFSALPSEAEYLEGGYLDHASMFLTYKIVVSPDDFMMIHALRNDLIIIGPDLPIKHPEQIIDVDHQYVELKPYGADAWSFQRVTIPEAAYLAEAKRGRLSQLANEEGKGFSVTTPLFGEARTFDSATLAGLRSWVVPDGQTINLPSTRQGMTSVDPYNQEQITQLIALYDQERATFHNSLMARVGQVHQATSRAELAVI